MARVTASVGPLSRPEGESGDRHSGSSGEASRSSLANVSLSSTPEAVTRALVVQTSPLLRIRLPHDPIDRKALLDRLYDAQRRCARVASFLARELWRRDSDSFDKFVIETGRVPKLSEWPKPEGNWYAAGRGYLPELYAGIVSSIARSVYRDWCRQRYHSFIRQEKKPLVEYRDTYPVPLRKQDLKFNPMDDGLLLSYSFETGRDKRIALELPAYDRFQRELYAKLLAGEWEYGDCRLKRDRKGRWCIQIVYKRLVLTSKDQKAAAINRGIRNFLVAITESGEDWIVDGAEIVSVMKQLNRRRRQYQNGAKSSSRAGRGRKRILRPLEKLRAKGERWRQKTIQTMAYRFVQWLRDRQVGVLYLEDFTGIRKGELASEVTPIAKLIHQWPYYQLEKAIEHNCNRMGIAFLKVSPEYITQECYACGHISKENVDLARWQFKCGECGRWEHLDKNAALNVLSRGRERSGDPALQSGESGPKLGRGRASQRTARKPSGNGTKSHRSDEAGGNGKKIV